MDATDSGKPGFELGEEDEAATRLELNWPLGTPRPLQSRVVQIWATSLAASDADVAALLCWLSQDERHRADRFRFQRDARRFIAARAFVRALIARHLGIEPLEIQFGYTELGKPFLANPAGESLKFNLAHCDDLAVCAIARAHDVGIDIERVRPVPDACVIAQQFFAPDEHAHIEHVAPELRPATFFRYWTRKEAYVKALGTGIGNGLDSFSVDAGSDPAPRVTFHRGVAPQVSLFHLDPAAGYVGALAVLGTPVRIECWRLGGTGNLPVLAGYQPASILLKLHTKR